MQKEIEAVDYKETKDFYNFIRQYYKSKENIGEVPDFMKVYYEIDRAHSFEMNKFYYAVCNYIFFGIEPSNEIKHSDNWKSIEPYAKSARKEDSLRYGEVY